MRTIRAILPEPNRGGEHIDPAHQEHRRIGNADRQYFSAVGPAQFGPGERADDAGGEDEAEETADDEFSEGAERAMAAPRFEHPPGREQVMNHQPAPVPRRASTSWRNQLGSQQQTIEHDIATKRDRTGEKVTPA